MTRDQITYIVFGTILVASLIADLGLLSRKDQKITIRQALNRARLTGQSPWEAFAELGSTLGIAELSELAASVSLAGSHGARIRASLSAKADAVRGHQVAETEAAAESATERMTIPVAVMLAGFLVFIAYPALMEVTSVA